MSKKIEILKYISTFQALNGTTLVSSSIALGIPRGMVARIARMRLELANWSADLDASGGAGDFEAQVGAVIVRDPDDQVTVSPPADEQDHDVLMHLYTDIVQNLTTSGMGSPTITGQSKDTGWIPKENRIVTAEDLRLNADAFGADAASLTEAGIRYHIWYEYEEAKDKDLLEILL